MARIKPGVFSWEDVLAQRYQNNKPPPLPRTRHCSIPASPQPHSQLLWRLSAELRLMIWEMVLGGLRIHIIQKSGQRLGHVVCVGKTTWQTADQKRSRARDTVCEICEGAGIPQPVKEQRDNTIHKMKRDRLLGLVMTCRQIYYESIHLLYTLNTFEFSNPWTLPYLRPTIPQVNWDNIRAIELRWSFPGHWLPSKDPVRAVYVSAGRAQWLETCCAVCRLPSLQSFVLVLGSTWFGEPVEKLPVFLEPLRDLRIQSRRRGFEQVEMRMVGDDGWGLSEDEEGSECSVSTGSLSSFSSSSSSPPPPPPVLKRSGSWELRLQGQLYYVQELGGIEEDLQRRGIDCWISTV